MSACGGGDGNASRSSPGFAVGTRVETLVDTTRSTEGRGEAPGQPSRTLETLVYYPAAGNAGGEPTPDAPAAARGPFPLIVFSHGSGVSSPARYDLLFRSWASAGYVIAAPTHPLSSTNLPGGGSDVVNQPADLSFVIGEMGRRSSDPASPYHRLVDGDRVGAAGHSLGAVTALGAVSNHCCLDARIRAAAILAGRKAAFPVDGWVTGPRAPLLVVHGDDDRLVRLAEGQQIFDEAAPPKAMLTVFGGDHNRPYGGSLATTENPERVGATLDGPTRVVNTTIVAFFDRYLKDRGDALARLGATLGDEVSVRLQVAE
ncbi:MAG: hypothetical protein M3203_12150 [Actinomycetota bacterium]|nr:hypothetical protein [Actinomycetota bacterium]